MITEMYMPKNGMDMTEGTIVKWLKNVGDRVVLDEPIMEIETDKITMETESPGSGILLKKLYDDGATVPVLTVLGYIGEAGDKLPEGTEAPEGASVPPQGAPASAEASPAAPASGEAACAATPHARKLASDKGISLSSVAATGRDGQITAGDVQAAANSTPVARAVAARNGVKLNETKGSGFGGKVTRADVEGGGGAASAVAEAVQEIEQVLERRNLTPMRRVIARRMLESHTDIPSVTQSVVADVTRLTELRRELNEARGTRVSLNDFVVRAAALAVKDSERVRMQYENGEYVLYSRVNIGVAVGLDDGLLVPVVRDADGKTLLELSAELKELASKAREGRLAKSDVGDARMTVTNMGMFGTHSFTPIINEPESAILGVCAAEDVLALNEAKEVETRKRMMLCLTYDHRILNGTEAAEFSNRIKAYLEQPLLLLQ